MRRLDTYPGRGTTSQANIEKRYTRSHEGMSAAGRERQPRCRGEVPSVGSVTLCLASSRNLVPDADVRGRGHAEVVGLPQAMAVCPRVLRATTADNRTAPRSRERRARRRPDVRSEADGQRARQHPLPNRRRRSGVAAIFTVATTAVAVHATPNVPPGRTRTVRAAIQRRERKRSKQALA